VEKFLPELFAYSWLFAIVVVCVVFTIVITFIVFQDVDLRCCDKTGTLSVGKDGSDIIMHGPGIVAWHAEIISRGSEITLVPRDGAVLHNGKLLQNPVKLYHGDRWDCML